MNRRRQAIGDELRAHAGKRRATEAAIAVHVLNRMLDLGRPGYVRVARAMSASPGLRPRRLTFDGSHREGAQRACTLDPCTTLATARDRDYPLPTPDS